LPLIELDTNVLVYAEGVERHPDDRRKVAPSRAIIRGLTRGNGWSAAVQALAELHAVLVRRAGRTPGVATLRVRQLTLSCAVVPTSEQVLEDALTLAADHRIQVYDAIIVAAAAETGAELLLSEDLHDGFTWRGVTVTNPFRQFPDARIAPLLSTA
jgi:predicted nucleic acid-binding protein